MSNYINQVNETHALYRQITDKLKSLIEGSKFEGHVYTVGGCERDRLLVLPIKDIDLVVDLPNGGIELSRWLYEKGSLTHEPVVYENYGTTMFSLKGFDTFELEAVQTRKESYRDMTTRNPETAYGTIEDDCIRRDFTVNSLYRNVSTGELKDFTGKGLDDLRAHIIRSCDDPNIIFKEDPLRIMRAVRFSAKLGWEIEEKTYQGLFDNVDRLEIVSRERITDEFDKILSYEKVMNSLRELKKIGALKYVSSQLDELTEEQFNNAVNGTRYTEPGRLYRLPVLFLETRDPESALRDMKYPNELVKSMCTCIHEIPVIQKLCDGVKDIDRVELRKLQSRMKDKGLFYITARAAHSINNRDNEVVRENQQVMRVFALSLRLTYEGTDCFDVKLPVDGEDVMDFKGIDPGPLVKKYLDLVKEAYFKNPKMTREEAYNLLSENHF